MLLGTVHYNRGFHQTATAGAFGATVAAGRLYGLDRAQMRAAVGLCATRASGLKSQFGTMGKPYNAGIAASNGVECALLAQAGLTSADDGLEGPQGFVPTHSDAPQTEGVWTDPPPGRFLFTDVKYKLHACCHGTHAMIEALAALKHVHYLTPEQVAKVHLRTSPRWLSVCDIKVPRSGLEVKFSYNWLAGMVLAGIPTASDRAYTDGLAGDAKLADFAGRVTVAGEAGVTDMQAAGEVRLTDGGTLPFTYDLAARLPDTELERSLRVKATGLIGAEGALIWAMVAGLDSLSARDLGKALA
jgi:2-methylcitrate dehydratase PrpD